MIDENEWTAYLDKWFLEYPDLKRYAAGQMLYDFLNKEIEKYYSGETSNLSKRYLKYEKEEKTGYESELFI